jgi:murein DD-endopeptidase MepM/ murein hydrolase activator NlpD
LPNTGGSVRHSRTTRKLGLRGAVAAALALLLCALRPIAWMIALSALTLSSATLMAQTGYKYRDENGQWVFTDQPRPSGQPTESFSFDHEGRSLHISVDRNDDADFTRLIAINGCVCVVTFQVSILQSGVTGISEGAAYKANVEPGLRQALVQVKRTAGDKSDLRYAWKAILGSPEAVHNPARPYRVPFGVGSTYVISQAYPSRITHTDAESQYAVDIALPNGTPVYSAREGTVINERHDSFRGATDPVMLDQANVVEILHSDGTIGVYAHLRWDSIRVRIGDRVARGQYIADSGNTGFSSGPHLHFAVLKNSGSEEVSVPVEFAGMAGVAVTPVSQMPLTAY